MTTNIKNRTIYCEDNLAVLRGINSGCVDLIYIDPPFNKKKVFTAPIGSSAEGASFKDIFYEEDVKEEWLVSMEQDYYELFVLLESVRMIEGRKSYNFCYLAYMAIRLIEMRRVLRDTGSIYLHCDPTMSHYLKVVMDCIFGEKMFRNEIVWCYDGSTKKDAMYFNSKHDVILLYTKQSDNKGILQQFKKRKGTEAFDYLYNKVWKKEQKKTVDKDREKWHPDYAYYSKIDKQTKERYRFHSTRKDGTERRYYMKDNKGTVVLDWWNDIESFGVATQASEKQDVEYPTQKPLALLERIIQASSNEGDMVLDAFCGCATTCVAAEKLGRQWVGIDVSQKAYDFVRERMEREIENPLLKGTNWNKEIHFTTTPPTRDDEGYMNGRTQKYVYILTNPEYERNSIYKVGIATNPQSRLKGFQTGAPLRDFEMKYQKSTPLYNEIEKYIHKKFNAEHEWMVADLQDIIDAIEGYKPPSKTPLLD